MEQSISQFANSPLREEIRLYLQGYLNVYAIQKIREDKDTVGLHHAMKVIDLAMSQLQKDYSSKNKKEKVDHTK